MGNKNIPTTETFAFASFVFCLNQSYSPSLDLAKGKTQLWVEEEKSEKETKVEHLAQKQAKK